MKKLQEYCSNCCQEVTIDAEFKMQVCPNCGKVILPCSMCDMDSAKCNACKLRVQDTPYEVYHNYPPIHVEGLYYLDDNDNKVTPFSIYFSPDLRIWFWDKTETYGRAYTMYGGAHGTTLAPVYLPDGTQYRNEDLVCVSAYYKNGVISDFYHE